MRSQPSRVGYLALTLGLGAVGVGAAAWLGWGDPAPMAAGAFGAWAIQAVAYWRLVAALDAGRSATRPWVLGMGARFGGLVLAAVAARSAPEGGMEVLLAFGAAILVFLLLEAVWLARRPPERARGAAPTAGSSGGAAAEPVAPGGGRERTTPFEGRREPPREAERSRQVDG